MKSIVRNSILLFAFIAGAMLSSCDNNVCKESMFTTMNVSMFHRDAAKTPLILSKVSLYRMENGSMIATDYKDSSFVTSFNLTLNPSSSITRFFLKSEEFRDTLIVMHTNSNEFVSAECGARLISHIDSIYFAGGRLDDSISITNPVVNGVYDAQNVKIYME